MRGRKSKYLSLDIKTNKKRWNVAVYLRISFDESEDDKENESIENQRKIVQEFLEVQEDIKSINYYIDDGISGTTFNRPGFQKMFADIQTEKVNAIVVKDLSRLGRNYLEVGNYLEQIFPLYNIRFIAINDNIDSFKNPSSSSNVLVAFKNLMNDEYARDISNKVKAVTKIRELNGEYCAGAAPYGYMKDPNNKHHLIIDEEAAAVVKKMYELSLNGYGGTRMCKYLNNNNIPSPAEYRKLKNNKNSDSKKCLWCRSNVKRILQNEVYCGDMVQGKFRTRSYKDHRLVDIPKEEWIIVRNTHEAIIDRDTFAKVQEAIKSRYIERNNKCKVENIFKNILVCNDCKRAMRLKTAENNWKCFYCGTYLINANTKCTKHQIHYKEVEKIVLDTINLQIKLILNLDNAIADIKRDRGNKYSNSLYVRNIEQLEKDLNKNKILKQKVYEDWKFNNVSKEEFNIYSEEYDKNIIYLKNELKLAKEKEEKYKKIINDTDWINDFKNNQKINSLSLEIVKKLIKKIYVCENKKLIIEFKYNDKYMELLKLTEELRKENNNVKK